MSEPLPARCLTTGEVQRMMDRVEAWNRLQRLLELLDRCLEGRFSIRCYQTTMLAIGMLCSEDVEPYVLEEIDA